jgi:formyl-CoA transferase
MTVDAFKNGPLSDLRVLELGTLLAGPFCGQLLGDMGAEVIKIEPPGQGDPMRGWGQQKAGEPSLWWPVVARNKKAITLDMRQAEGQALFKEMVKNTDFVLENFRPGTMEKWNCGWEELHQINPRLIMIRVSGYGQTGPYSHRAGFGAIGEAMGGLRYVVGDPSTPPSRMGISIGDELAATFACLGALSALHYRDKTGEGQMVDSALYEAVLNMMESLMAIFASVRVPSCRMSPHPMFIPRRTDWSSSPRIKTRFSGACARRWDNRRWRKTRATLTIRPAAATRHSWMDW